MAVRLERRNRVSPLRRRAVSWEEIKQVRRDRVSSITKMPTGIAMVWVGVLSIVLSAGGLVQYPQTANPKPIPSYSGFTDIQAAGTNSSSSPAGEAGRDIRLTPIRQNVVIKTSSSVPNFVSFTFVKSKTFRKPTFFKSSVSTPISHSQGLTP